MADTKSAAPAAGMTEQAMNRVLAAEHDAAQAVAECEARTRDLVQAAQQRANRIASRTDERITLMQMRCKQRVAATLKQLQQTPPSPDDHNMQSLDDTDLRTCMARVAEMLTTATVADTAKRSTGK